MTTTVAVALRLGRHQLIGNSDYFYVASFFSFFLHLINLFQCLGFLTPALRIHSPVPLNGGGRMSMRLCRCLAGG